MQQVKDRTKGKAQPEKNLGVILIMSQKANFSRSKLDGQGEASTAETSQGMTAGATGTL